MLLRVLIGFSACNRFMNVLRVAAQEGGMELAQSPLQAAMLHGVSSAFYLVESMLGLVLFWRLPPGQFPAQSVIPKGKTASVAARRARLKKAGHAREYGAWPAFCVPGEPGKAYFDD